MADIRHHSTVTPHRRPGVSAPIRLFILAEVRLYREGLEQILGSEDPFVIVGGAPSLAVAIREVDTEVIAWAEAGMAGYVSRQASLADLSATIRRAAVCEFVCPPHI